MCLEDVKSALKERLTGIEEFLMAIAPTANSWAALDAACRQLLLQLPITSRTQLHVMLVLLSRQEVTKSCPPCCVGVSIWLLVGRCPVWVPNAIGCTLQLGVHCDVSTTVYCMMKQSAQLRHAQPNHL